MSLIAGDDLVSEKFFSSGNARPRGSSFDLTVGSIFDHNGVKAQGPFRLKPGHMVQIVSAEVFNLPPTITGHVTYKTQLTRIGIWALTVGIVDPGWKGPVSTTLLNFSSVEHPIAQGDSFLRVSFFDHAIVSSSHLPTSCLPEDLYLQDIQKTAMTRFPETFLNQEAIVLQAGNRVLDRIRSEGIVWIAAIAVIFTVIQIVAPLASDSLRRIFSEPKDMEITQLRRKIEALESRVNEAGEPKSLVPNVLPLKTPSAQGALPERP